MIYLNKLLFKINECPTLFKTQDVVLSMGLNSSNIKGLKKFAIEKEFIKQDKNGCFLTAKGEEYLLKNPLKTWEAKEFPLRSDVNVEYLKEDKIVSVLMKAMRIYAKYLIDKQPLKENSLEYAIAEDVEKCRKLYTSIEYYILNGKRNNLDEMFQIYLSKGLTKSIIAVVFLKVLSENLDKIAIYEKAQFQLKFDTLMFDRMVACPENFELQKTIMDDIYIY